MQKKSAENDMKTKILTIISWKTSIIVRAASNMLLWIIFLVKLSQHKIIFFDDYWFIIRVEHNLKLLLEFVFLSGGVLISGSEFNVSSTVFFSRKGEGGNEKEKRVARKRYFKFIISKRSELSRRFWRVRACVRADHQHLFDIKTFPGIFPQQQGCRSVNPAVHLASGAANPPKRISLVWASLGIQHWMLLLMVFSLVQLNFFFFFKCQTGQI